MATAYERPQLPPLPQQLFIDPRLENPANVTLGGGWSLANGELHHNPATGQFSKVTLRNLPAFGNATDLAVVFDVVSQVSTNLTNGVRAMFSGNTSTDLVYHGWFNRTDLVPPKVIKIPEAVSHIFGRLPTQNP